MIGLAARGRNAVSGEFMAQKAIKGRKARLMIVAADASENTRKHFSDMCAHYGVPIYIYGDRLALGKATGKEARVDVVITEKGLADSIRKLIEEQGGEDSRKNEKSRQERQGNSGRGLRKGKAWL